MAITTSNSIRVKAVDERLLANLPNDNFFNIFITNDTDTASDTSFDVWRTPSVTSFMSKKNAILIAAAVVLSLVYVIYFTDWFKPKTVRIYHVVRTPHVRRAKAKAEPVLIFGVNQKLKLTEIKVVPVDEFKTNQFTLPLWHLVSDSNSAAVSSIVYGQPIRGLKPAIKGSTPQTLATNVTYRLIVTADTIKGEHDFVLK
ncbi:MAG: hypothetical protein WCS94_14125 [Verrucomicrobiota bacterium]